MEVSSDHVFINPTSYHQVLRRGALFQGHATLILVATSGGSLAGLRITFACLHGHIAWVGDKPNEIIHHLLAGDKLEGRKVTGKSTGGG